METARGSISVKGSSDEAHRRWLAFTGQSGSPEGVAAVSSSRSRDEVEKGKVYFHDQGDGSTRVTMELRYNPVAVKEADLSDDWVSRRIELYLRRFKEHAEW